MWSSVNVYRLQVGMVKAHKKLFVLTSAALNTSCQFQPLQLSTNCVIVLKGENMDMHTSTVPGFVAFNQEQLQMNTSCNQTKEVIIFNGEGNEMLTDNKLALNDTSLHLL